MNKIYMNEVDRRVMANEMADNYAQNLDEIQLLTFDVNFLLSDLKAKYEEADISSTEFNKQWAEKIADLREAAQYEEYIRVYDGLENPISFLVDEEGMFTVDELMKRSFIKMDKD